MNNLNNGLSEFSGNNVIDDLTHINSSKDLPHKENDEKDIYYLTVNEKNFMEKMAEWHVELEDNKPEEIPPWKEKI